MLWAYIGVWSIEKSMSTLIVSIVCTLLFAILGAIFVFKYEFIAIIYGTTVIGSYAFMRGWSLIIQGSIGEQ